MGSTSTSFPPEAASRLASKVHPSRPLAPPNQGQQADLVHGPLLHAGRVAGFDRGGYRPVAWAPCRSHGWESSVRASWARASPRWRPPPGYEVVLRSRSQDCADAMVASLATSLAKQVEKGKRTEAEADEIAARVSRHDAPGRAGRRRPGDRVGGRGPRGQAGPLRRARQHLQAARPSSPPTPRPCRWSRWRWPRAGPTWCAASTSSTRRRPWRWSRWCGPSRRPTPRWRRPWSSPPPAARTRSR